MCWWLRIRPSEGWGPHQNYGKLLYCWGRLCVCEATREYRGHACACEFDIMLMLVRMPFVNWDVHQEKWEHILLSLGRSAVSDQLWSKMKVTIRIIRWKCISAMYLGCLEGEGIL